MSLTEFARGRIWLEEYPVRYFGCRFKARMTVVRLSSGRIMLHSPCEMDRETRKEIEALGEVAYIVAPGSYHYFHVRSAQLAFPAAETFICPGVERKRPDIHVDWILGDRPPPAWQDELSQALVRGTKYIWEVAFFHQPTRTLLLVDLVENITDGTEGINWVMRFWWKAVLRMWNRPLPAPEYRFGWGDREAARISLERILTWDFERVVIAHGDLIETNAKEVLRRAWKTPLGHGRGYRQRDRAG